jgi:hypothetical protein
VNEKGLSKEDAAELQLEAAFFLYLHDFSQEAVHTLVSATRGILYGLASHRPNLVLEKWDKSILAKVIGSDPKAMRSYQNRVANFLKHADRDPTAKLSKRNLKALNEAEMQLCAIALSICKESISKKVNWAIWYLGLTPNAVIPFDVIAREYTGSMSQSEIIKMRDIANFRSALLDLYIL